MRSATISINDLYEFEGKEVPVRPDAAAVTAIARRQFAFLPEPLTIEINGRNVTVTFPAESEAAQNEAARLADRAARRASAGEFKKAVPIYTRVLELHPTLHQARRDLAMVCMEMGDLDAARNHLVEVLRLKPDDAWSWVVLGNTYGKSPDDFAIAGKFFRRALEIAPRDPWALNSLASIAGQRGDTGEAIRLFQEALKSSPGFPNAIYGLAVAYNRSRQPDEALAALEDLFKRGRKLDARSQEVFDQGRVLYAGLQELVSDREAAQAASEVEKLRSQAGHESGFAITTTEGEFKDTTGATIQMAWKHGRDHHLIKLRPGLPEIIRTHLMAHELTHLELETAAREAGANQFMVTTDRNEDVAKERISGDLRKLTRRGYPGDSIQGLTDMWIRGLTRFLYNCPLDMIIETRLRERVPALRAAQFVSVKQSVEAAYRTNVDPKIREITPGLILRASLALNGAFCLFLDGLFAGATDYSALYRKEESFGFAQRLYQLWRDRSPMLGPGDEYALVDGFADILGLKGWYDWRADRMPTISGGEQKLEGVTNPELLKAKDTAAALHLLGALERYDILPVEKVQEIAFEIAMMGQTGLDYSSPESKYALKSVPGETFTGLQLMCLMYAGFKRFAPDQELPMDLEDSWLKALEMFQARRRG